MLLTLVTGAFALIGLQQVDTTVAVTRGQRLDIHASGGDVLVRSWNRDAVRVETNSSGRDRVEITSSANSVTVRSQGRRDSSSERILRVSAPPWMGLRLSGVHTDVNVEGIRAPISVETVEGGVEVSGGEGLISLRSVQGHVSLRSAKGRINVFSVNEDVVVTGSSGEIMAETVNGEITLEMIDASAVDASTVNGDVSYTGPIRNGGRYALSTHNGDVTVTVPEGTNASVAVSTFSGEFESEFPVPIRGTQKGKGFSFTLGSGSAQVTLESFQGTIELVRPGTARSRDRDHDSDD